MNNLRVARKAAGFTQEEAAAYINLSQPQYSAWENGRCKKIDPQAITKLAARFNVTTDYLLGQVEKMKESTVKDDGLTEVEWALIKIFRQIPPEEQDRVVRIVQAASDSLQQPLTLPSEGQ